MNKKVILGVIISLIISSIALFVSYKKLYYPVELYHVYIEGKTIGYIESKKELEDYINRVELSIKNKYNVKNVYSPKNLNIVKEMSYNSKASDVKDIYEKIKKISPFTIKGYIVTIKGVEKTELDKKYKSEDVKINILDKNIFETAFKKTIFTFVKEEDYDNFINKTQKEITDAGTLIEDIYIKNDITIKESRISVDDEIFTDADLLTKYLLFGTLDTQKTYNVKQGDTIEQISLNNKISTNEFLIANTEFTSADNLLYPGQTVTLGIVRPQFELVEEDHIVSIEDKKFKTEIVYDDTMLYGSEKVKQEGKNGKSKVTKKIQKVNGEIEYAQIVSNEVVTPSVNRIIVRGSGSVITGPGEIISGNLGTWSWPTTSPYVISSGFQWRWGAFHDGLDITGTGYGSPIYAANDGTVTDSSFTSQNGYYIIIDHHNGIQTIYGHLSKLLVKAGQNVTIGQKIGLMGSTGVSTGVHLHFGVWRGKPYYGGTAINPMSLY